MHDSAHQAKENARMLYAEKLRHIRDGYLHISQSQLLKQINTLTKKQLGLLQRHNIGESSLSLYETATYLPNPQNHTLLIAGLRYLTKKIITDEETKNQCLEEIAELDEIQKPARSVKVAEKSLQPQKAKYQKQFQTAFTQFIQNHDLVLAGAASLLAYDTVQMYQLVNRGRSRGVILTEELLTSWLDKISPGAKQNQLKAHVMECFKSDEKHKSTLRRGKY